LTTVLEPGEFAANQITDAMAFIAALPASTRVYVQEWTGEAWRFVFGDARDRAPWGLYRVTPGARFRVCPMSFRS
jgi:hypothetical protein